MLGGLFFGSLAHVNQMMGNLFYRGVAPFEIEGMGFKQMQYWDGWHKVMAKEEKDAAERLRKG